MELALLTYSEPKAQVDICIYIDILLFRCAQITHGKVDLSTGDDSQLYYVC